MTKTTAHLERRDGERRDGDRAVKAQSSGPNRTSIPDDRIFMRS